VVEFCVIKELCRCMSRRIRRKRKIRRGKRGKEKFDVGIK
jgi:hypothetical protein